MTIDQDIEAVRACLLTHKHIYAHDNEDYQATVDALESLSRLESALSGQAVEVEALKREVTSYFTDLYIQCEGDDPFELKTAKRIIEATIDHLATTGRLTSKQEHREDARDRKDVLLLVALGFTHKIENGFHVVEGYGFKYSHVQLLNIAHRIKQEFFKPAPDMAKVRDDKLIVKLHEFQDAISALALKLPPAVWKDLNGKYGELLDVLNDELAELDKAGVEVIEGLETAIREVEDTSKDCVGELHYPCKQVIQAARAYLELAAKK